MKQLDTYHRLLEEKKNLYAGMLIKVKQEEPTNNSTLIYVLLIIFVIICTLIFLAKCAYDRNNSYLMMNLPESERKVYAAIVGIEREHDARM